MLQTTETAQLLTGYQTTKTITLIFDWQQPISAAMKSGSKPGILWFIMNLQLVGTDVSVCALEFGNGSVDQQGMFLL